MRKKPCLLANTMFRRQLSVQCTLNDNTVTADVIIIRRHSGSAAVELVTTSHASATSRATLQLSLSQHTLYIFAASGANKLTVAFVFYDESEIGVFFT